VLQKAFTICSRLSHSTGWAALPFENISRSFFLRAEKPSKDITPRLFLMNMKGLKRGRNDEKREKETKEKNDKSDQR
jgi:hypothetical protein